MNSQIRDIAGQTFGRLTVKELAPKPWTRNHAEWICQCSCGKEVIVDGTHLRSGHTQSCGCLQSDLTIARNLGGVHGHSYTQDGLRTPTYYTWRGMKQRCLNSKHIYYHRYGGRGITICERWIDSFVNFLEDMGVRPEGKTLDRIDNDGNYEPSNCRWSTAKEQRANQRSKA